MKKEIDTLNKCLCMSRFRRMDSNAIFKQLEGKSLSFLHMAKIAHFQFMTLMGWLGNEAVLFTDAEGEETTIGGICHCMAADGVGSAGKDRMIVAGVCDKRKQDELFDKTCNQLQTSWLCCEHWFCESF